MASSGIGARVGRDLGPRVLSGLVLAAVAIGAIWAGPIPLAVLLALVAQGGDLAESSLKRRFGAKDASTLIPGHGGFMDRVDGLATAAMLAATWAAWSDLIAPAHALLTW